MIKMHCHWIAISDGGTASFYEIFNNAGTFEEFRASSNSYSCLTIDLCCFSHSFFIYTEFVHF